LIAIRRSPQAGAGKPHRLLPVVKVAIRYTDT
jgi:hypothetical protein